MDSVGGWLCAGRYSHSQEFPVHDYNQENCQHDCHTWTRISITRSGKFYQELELIPKLEPRRLILWRQPDLGLRTADGGLRVQWLHLLWRTERNRGHRQ